eukprot:CAMPEP_0117423872 /NCGR_PEP_ID=MMETSP0758-20121206/4404_1 /TAXON_ID=63605 /ORGANISM="Percolomonas cosmopolitus, Strain AE-1 (ATCC 50343)" /LENGTH=166 /DNA_ID=CAMNT_0005207311 /DNA_START=829 /DNA_END=1329 /DNA_ORIENTATION=-
MEESVFPQSTSLLPTQWGNAWRAWRNRSTTNNNSTNEETNDSRFQGPGRTLSGTTRPQQYSHTQATINPEENSQGEQQQPQQPQQSRLSSFFNNIRSNIRPVLNRSNNDYAHLQDDEEELQAYVSDDDDISIPGDDDENHQVNRESDDTNSSHFDNLDGGRKLGSA